MRFIIIFSFILTNLLLSSPNSKLNLGKNYYKFGNYEKAIKTIKMLPMELDKDSDKIEAYKILGSSYYFVKEFENSKKAFINMLGISSEATLDSLLYPPPLIEFFNRIETEFQKKNRELEKITNKDKKEIKIIYKDIYWKYVEEKRIIIEKNPFFTKFMPFGYAQYRNGDISKAYVLVTAESILLTTNLLSYWLTRSLADKNGYYDDDANRRRAEVYVDIQKASLVALIGFFIYGGADGIINHKPIFKREIRVLRKKPIKWTDPIKLSLSGDNMITLSYKF